MAPGVGKGLLTETLTIDPASFVQRDISPWKIKEIASFLNFYINSWKKEGPHDQLT